MDIVVCVMSDVVSGRSGSETVEFIIDINIPTYLLSRIFDLNHEIRLTLHCSRTRRRSCKIAAAAAIVVYLLSRIWVHANVGT